MNIESKLWKVISLNASQLMIIQKASGASAIRGLSALPGLNELAVMSEVRFDRLCREAFHDERTRK